MKEDRTVLIVDDDERNIFAMTAVMKAMGFTVLSAPDGYSGVETLKSHPEIDVVLMDIMMPGMDGYEAIKKIREDIAINDIPIIALTAKAMVGDREKCLEAGASDYCSKPVDITELLGKINKCRS